VKKGRLRWPHFLLILEIRISPLGEINFPYHLPWQQANQMDQDALAIMGKKPMLVPGEEGLRDIRIVEAILESAKTGNRVMI
jgi:glucose-fructose oxidoreductase